ncbi:MAG: UvrD-helicase domain-containing protein [Oscillospiraceae bacterium]|nr:UvrD-helicase domain-containing protein [Oscillospiraceae bacterium]
MGFEFTPAQNRAIDDRGGAILVSAAAGSGKTRVLTERLVRRVTEGEQPSELDRFLVITYTRAAAAELRERIMTELGKRAAAHPEDRRLRRQQSLCVRAHIGTIHSFCAEVVRENCHLLSLPPAFTVLD